MIAYIRVVDETFRKGQAIEAMATGTRPTPTTWACLVPRHAHGRAVCGRVGYLITGVKDVTQLRVGDTLTSQAGACGSASKHGPGHREVKPMVFCGLFPIDSEQYPIGDAPEKLTLNDAALS